MREFYYKSDDGISGWMDNFIYYRDIQVRLEVI